ncbi:hypothetical protein COCC4DRAFT_144607 [Bipolaris maydis ATCC 48331]|uniref:Uncharacterized protein n=2 Tax=Cochliobolus heterostrophus TaxID=5016 RepID=M2VDX3_COCH5|nr:uncharacterized protein COCC4DRAFT_144607 [Bipolaris maydis ATCC 48331]EMD97878.1 hypothetical protein COCHEDRAFT_1086299 [Bipolaris maydis C5]ENI02725.1 hypothetical protein COCC4DRAFT_144607 [Bipolaris maydis ATCC 48331]
MADKNDMLKELAELEATVKRMRETYERIASEQETLSHKGTVPVSYTKFVDKFKKLTKKNSEFAQASSEFAKAGSEYVKDMINATPAKNVSNASITTIPNPPFTFFPKPPSSKPSFSFMEYDEDLAKKKAEKKKAEKKEAEKRKAEKERKFDEGMAIFAAKRRRTE